MSIHALQDSRMAAKKLRIFQMRTTDEFLGAVDDWRAAQRPVLSRAEAIHRLVTYAIEKKQKKPKRLI
jgi:hypothetical protein